MPFTTGHGRDELLHIRGATEGLIEQLLRGRWCLLTWRATRAECVPTG